MIDPGGTSDVEGDWRNAGTLGLYYALLHRDGYERQSLVSGGEIGEKGQGPQIALACHHQALLGVDGGVHNLEVHPLRLDNPVVQSLVGNDRVIRIAVG